MMEEKERLRYEEEIDGLYKEIEEIKKMNPNINLKLKGFCNCTPDLND